MPKRNPRLTNFWNITLCSLVLTVYLVGLGACNTVLGIDEDLELLPATDAGADAVQVDAKQADAGMDGTPVDAALADAAMDGTPVDAAVPDAVVDAAPADAASPFPTIEQSKLLPSAYSPLFGHSVALDRDTAVVGTPANGTCAYVFVRSGGSWTQQAQLQGSDTLEGDYCGRAVALDGDTIIVGADRNDVEGVESAGAAYVFHRSGTTWTEQAKLTASDFSFNAAFALSVSVTGDTAVVGSPFHESAYVFTRSGSVWTEETKLTATAPAGLSYFGFSVSLSGNTVLVGAYQSNLAYVFQGSGATWTEQAILTASNAGPNDRFGEYVSLDGDTAIVGATTHPVDGVTNAGSAYIYSRSGSVWTEEAILVGKPPHEYADLFGYSVAIEGDMAVVGARNEEDTLPNDTGIIYVYSRTGTVWSERSRFQASDLLGGDRLGSSVSLSGETILAGADQGYNADADQEGAAYVFIIDTMP